jgi:hypothetical protein
MRPSLSRTISLARLLARPRARAFFFAHARARTRSFSLMFSPFGRLLRLRVHNTTPGVMLRDKIQAQR